MKVNPIVFFTSATAILGFVILAVVCGALDGFPVITGEPAPPDGYVNWLSEVLGGMSGWIIQQFGWFYILIATVFLVFVTWLFVSPYGSIKLGKDDDVPAYSLGSWFAMLFSAGMGIGLLFWSVAEPMNHYFAPPPGSAAAEAGFGAFDGNSIKDAPEGVERAAARSAMTTTFFHWGLHAWAIYILLGMSLAYFSFRHNLPLTIRSTLYPLLGKRIFGPIGDIVEVMAVFGTLFGVATSLGLGVMQINAGLASAGILPGIATSWQLLLILLITIAATISVVSGLDKGIKRLSELNLGIGLILLLFVFIAGPTLLLLNSFVENVGNYASEVVQKSFNTMALEGEDGQTWQGWWTMFYWGWWISWSPFVGMFIARISRGRTIRAFVGGVLIVPTLLTFVWLTMFGNAAIDMERNPDNYLDDVALAEANIQMVPKTDEMGRPIDAEGNVIKEGSDAEPAREPMSPDGKRGSVFAPLLPVEDEATAADLLAHAEKYANGEKSDPPNIAYVDGEVLLDDQGRPMQRQLQAAEVQLFTLLGGLPMSILMIVLATIVIATFFVTSSDSGSLVIDILTSGGHPKPPVGQKIFWALTEGAVAATLLVVGGRSALGALQAMAISTALPFSIIMVFITYALYKGLRRERKRPKLIGVGYRIGRPGLLDAEAELDNAPTAQEPPPEVHADTSWQARLKQVATDKFTADPTPAKPGDEAEHLPVTTFLDETIRVAFTQLKEQLDKHGREAVIDEQPHALTLRVLVDGDEEFSYGVRGYAHHRMSFAFPVLDDTSNWVYRADVVVDGQRRSSHPLNTFTVKTTIEDFLREYAVWKGW